MSEIGGGSDLWVRTYHQAPAGSVGLLCLPHAGGSATFFRPLSAALAPKVQVLAVQYPGRQDRRAERCRDSIDELADEIFAVLSSRTQGPSALAFFGHSMGAVLAFEVARRFQQVREDVPGHLFVSGRRPPGLSTRDPMRKRDDREILAELHLLDGTDSSFLQDQELLQMVMPAIRADYHAVDRYTYIPGPRLRCPVTVLVGDQDPRVTPEQAHGWRDHTSGSFHQRVFPGGHFYLSNHHAEVADVVLRRPWLA